MLDPLTTPLLVLVLGKLAHEIIADVCKDHLKEKLKSFLGWLESLGERDKVELAYQDAMEQAYGSCLEMLLLNIKSFGYTDAELKQYESSLKAFIKDNEVAEELLNAVREPTLTDLPSPDVLAKRWKELGGVELPSENLWPTVAAAFRRHAGKRLLLSDDLRELMNAQNLEQLKELIERQGGVKTQVRRDKYSQRMRTKFSPVDLANLMPAYADDPGRMVIREVFVPQNVRGNPPPVEIPKDVAERSLNPVPNGPRVKDDETTDGTRGPLGTRLNEDEAIREMLRTAYVSQSPKPVLDVIGVAGNRLLVLTGEPGSGKSTLMRYLLTGIIEPPVDRQSGLPLSWTLAFEDAFPLLIELRDFYALRRQDECDSFLEYVDYMGKTDGWFLDQHALDGYLVQTPSLVMFDGLDEIFDTADRERLMSEIAGFAQRYPRARIIVTSRPVGYKERILRDAGFALFGIQDLDDGQIDAFIRGWFALTFPQRPQQAQQRIERVLGSVKQSKPIRLLAGNPMLLTIMALLAREDELPRERAKFYEKAVEVLCHHWDANRNLQLPEDRYLNADDKKALLRRIAMRMVTGVPYDRRTEFIPFTEGDAGSKRNEFRFTVPGLKGNIIAEADLEQEIHSFLIDEQWQTDAAEAKKAARGMIRQFHERNYILCLRGPHLFGFLHRTFLEYLTASQYVQWFNCQPQQMTLDELSNLFVAYCRDDDWREVLELVRDQINVQVVVCVVEHLAIHQTPLFAVEWVDGNTRSCFLESARTSESFQQRIAALRILGQKWPDDSTRAFLAQQAVEDEHQSPRLAALNTLAEKWPDASTRRLLAERAVVDRAYETRLALLRSLAEKWQDASTRELLVECANQDQDQDVRCAAFGQLAEHWPDENTRVLLVERAIFDEHEDARRLALQTLIEKWPDENTRELLAQRAVQDDHYAPRRAALQALAEKWPDANTRELLAQRAVQDDDEYTRRTVLRALAEKWPDPNTRELLAQRAVQDDHYAPRRAALQALAEKWPDENTRKLLAERARIDGVAASIFGGQHSEFGRRVFGYQAEVWGPYFDPRQPISRDNIERAAEKAGILLDKIDETVRSLSEHLGWDITRGSG